MTRGSSRRVAQQGFSLVELMIASTISLLVTAALVGTFVGNSRARTELDASSRQIENGRYALELLAEELRLAGFYGEVPMSGVLQATASPCAVGAAQLGWQATPLRVPVPVQRGAPGAADAACLVDRAAGTPALSIRRLSTQAILPAAISGTDEYVQGSSCDDDAANPDIVVSGAAADFVLRNLACDGPAGVRRIIQRTYYVADCSICGLDSIPSLKRLEWVGNAWQLSTLVEGIEALGLDLGFDLDGDGAPDSWRTGPDNVAGSPANDWGNVMAVRIHVLSRTTQATAGYTDDRVYELGLAGSVGPFGDGYKRRVYSAVVRLNNPAGRREL